MIGRLTGQLLECRPGQLLIDVSGVGYAVQIPLGTFYALSAESGSAVTLHIHTHVREDSLQLFGFDSAGERATFEKLIGISGVGPRLALSILSGIDAEELRRVVEREDRQRLQKIPGVGRKTAERLLLELRDKLKHDPSQQPVESGKGDRRLAPADGALLVRQDALSALLNLGYTQDAANRAVDAAWNELGSQGQLEPLLRAALRGLAT